MSLNKPWTYAACAGLALTSAALCYGWAVAWSANVARAHGWRFN